MKQQRKNIFFKAKKSTKLMREAINIYTTTVIFCFQSIWYIKYLNKTQFLPVSISPQKKISTRNKGVGP